MIFTPNTTPTPNWLYNGEMKKMTDTELRVVLIITRATLGWIDPVSGGRRKQDWISQKQFMAKSGKSNRAIATAIDNCIKNGWVEAYDKTGKQLNTPKSRSGNKVIYQLGNIFLKKVSQTCEESSQDESQTCELNDTKPVKKVHSTKETLTKEKKSATSLRNEDCPPITSKRDITSKRSIPSKGSPQEKSPQTPKENWTKQMIIWLEEQQGQKFANCGKQAKNLKNLQEAGYTCGQVKECYFKMIKDTFWKGKFPDYKNIADNIQRFLKVEKKEDNFDI